MADRLSPPDQVLVAAMEYLCCAGWEDFENQKMALGIVRDTIRHASHDHPRVGPLIEAAEAMLLADTHGTARQKLSAMQTAKENARRALAAIALYRLGVLLEKRGVAA